MRAGDVVRRLKRQGYPCALDVAPIYAPWVRLAPAADAAWLVAGILLGSPVMLWAAAGSSLSGAITGLHPAERLALAIRRPGRFRRPPPSPRPRRFAMALDATLAAAAALCFSVGARPTGTVIGLLLAAACVLTAASYHCLGSALYGRLVRRRRDG